MAVTLVYDNVLSRVRITANGLGGAASALVERSTDQVRWTTVRGGEAVPVVAGSFGVFLDDYEFAPGQVNYYRAVSDTLTDSYTRTVAAGSWGTTDTGQVWAAANPVWSVSGTQGISTFAASGLQSNVLAGTTGLTDVLTTVKLQSAQKLTGAGAMFPSMSLRRVDANNFYQIGLYYQASATATGLVGVVISKLVAGVGTNLFANFGFEVYDATETFWLKAQCIGTTIRVKVWRTTVGEPGPWTASVTDATYSTGSVAVISSRDAGVTNVSPLIRWDDLTVTASRITIQPAATITPILDSVWLKSISRPFLNRRVNVILLPKVGVTRPSRAGIFDVVDRSLPVAVNTVRGSRRWPMYIRTETAADATNTDLLLASGDPLLVQGPAGCGVETGYVSVGDTYSEIHPLRPLRKTFTLPLTEVAAPGPGVVGSTSTWATVLATYATWADVLAANPTWASLLDLIGSPSEVIVP